MKSQLVSVDISRLTAADSWADRKLAEVKLGYQSPSKPFKFLTSCIELDSTQVELLQRLGTQSRYEDMARACDLAAFERALGYTDPLGLCLGGLMLKDDYHVSYYTSFFKSVRCYYLEHSRIEWVWVDSSAWESLNDLLQR